MTPVTHTITLKQGGVKYLRDMLSGSGWAKSVADIILGGGLLVEKVPEVPEPPPLEGDASKPEVREAHKVAVKAWSVAVTPPFSLSEKEREACRKCITHFATQGLIPPTTQAAELLLAFGFSAD